jgi:hypothetical protein
VQQKQQVTQYNVHQRQKVRRDAKSKNEQHDGEQAAYYQVKQDAFVGQTTCQSEQQIPATRSQPYLS